MSLGLTGPRWEWRTFGPDFAAAEAEMRRRRLKRRAGREVLIVGGCPSMETRIRDRRLEIRERLQSTAEGLAQWTLLVDVAFPIGARLLLEVFAHWQCAPPQLVRPTYCVEDLLAVIADANLPLRPVEVMKEGYSCVIEGCYVESADLLASERVCTRTIAVDMIDPLRVMQVVAMLGLTGRTPLSFAQALNLPIEVPTRLTSGRAHPAERLRAIASSATDH